jgi:hypothetical protein
MKAVEYISTSIAADSGAVATTFGIHPGSYLSLTQERRRRRWLNINIECCVDTPSSPNVVGGKLLPR